MGFTFDEAAYLAYILWAYPHVPSDLRIESIALPSDNDILDDPSEWGIQTDNLRKRLHKLSDKEQQGLREQFARLSEFDLRDRSTISDILHCWVQEKDNEKSRRYLKKRFDQIGISLINPLGEDDS